MRAICSRAGQNKSNAQSKVILERGKHIVLYGERGVGKTSFARVLGLLFPSIVSQVVLILEQADPSDDFSSIWRKVFKDIKLKLGEEVDLLNELYLEGEQISPDDVRRALEGGICYFLIYR